MPSPIEEQNVAETDWFDPFPELRTIPSGWDVSELLSAPPKVPVSEWHGDHADTCTCARCKCAADSRGDSP
jgi:hypothetical protein